MKPWVCLVAASADAGECLRSAGFAGGVERRWAQLAGRVARRRDDWKE